jgi:fimbrial chaperone protein
MFSAKLIPLVATAILLSAPLRATSLQVQPAMIDVSAPGAASTLTLRNEGQTAINVQVRVFRWLQSDGEERLETTEDVVASPPAVALAPNADYVARVVRVTKRAVEGEETYRLVVDELPDATQAQTNTVRMLVRHSIPVFFSASERTPPNVDWSVSRSSSRVMLSARNNGDSHLRVSALTLRDQYGKKISFGGGLVGYALGRSTMRWVAPGSTHGFAPKGSVSVSSQGNDGPLHATAEVVASP